MKPGQFRCLIPAILLLVVASVCPRCRAEHGFVLVQVQDTKHCPVRGVEIGIEGIGGSRLTGDDGKAQLPVGSDTKVGDWLSLTILHSPPGKDLVINSPSDRRSPVPPFEDKPENFIQVEVVQRGDRAALENRSVRISSAEKYNEKAYSPNSTGKATPPQDPKVNRAAVAKQYGLSPDEMDRAIRAWGRKTTDPYEAAQAALYEGNFSKASVLFQDLLKQREEKLGADQRTVTQDQNQVYNAAFF